MTVSVAVVAEYYPSEGDPVLGIWAHRQAQAAHEAGARVRVLVLHRLVPPLSALRAGPRAGGRALRGLLAEPHRQVRDGIEVFYVPYVSPPRPSSYESWGAWAAPPLALALRRHARGADLIHAHNAVPAADAVRGSRMGLPLIVSVHGSDVLYTVRRGERGRRAVQRGLGAAQLVLANSRGIAAMAQSAGARETLVVHLGADLPEGSGRVLGMRSRSEPGGLGGGLRPPQRPLLVTVAHVIPRKRHGDVVRALAVLAARHPALRYVVVGDGPEREPLAKLARRLGVADRVEFRGQLEHRLALEEIRRATLFVMPSLDEAFGVAYVEAMAAGVPAIGCRGEPGPEEIAAAGDGMVLVPPGDVERLSQRIDELLSDPQRLDEASRNARVTVAASFTWEACGRETVAAYERVLAR